MTAQQLADRIGSLPPPARDLVVKWRRGFEFLGRCDGDVSAPLAEFVGDLQSLWDELWRNAVAPLRAAGHENEGSGV